MFLEAENICRNLHFLLLTETDGNGQLNTLQYAALDILAQGSYVRSYLCFFYLNKVIFAGLDVSSLPIQKC